MASDAGSLNSWLITVILLPIIAGLFKKEIGDLVTAWKVYKSRPFDADRDSKSPDRCELLNAATGEFVEVEIQKYVFSINRDVRGVYINHLLPDGRKSAEKISLIEWATMRKRHIPK